MDPMSLVTPAIGLMFWTCIIFTLLIVLLRKFAWKPILTAVDDRNEQINSALKAADKARLEIENLNNDNERILLEAKSERDQLLKEARDIKDNIINEAKEKASNEAENILNAAKSQIENEKMKAITELKNSVAVLSIDIAEKVLKNELKEKSNQEDFINSILKNSELN
ncbi:MAG: F0F1 ATP synthase subunit B [Flavobacteriales bacterium]|jgi:F-type H+-transporting ATPase subunit b|nr:F0F1 ATP synthase subunit B [Flavobacteriales bacterium]MDG1426126.1 F0F1 ATP synthase subunit B [Flavobacteriales bacterium]MDG1933973.1 F0F1 ATP synthase subunit B [Flavobacteriales bacterium]MDG2086851.1 F0F1 ATP synthase subunit B [Flavobacteriales bacterium]|tara:strand:+ start:5780 stop:6283 length:504 start_codon:yes stop_codon:yes gene_type:complete